MKYNPVDKLENIRLALIKAAEAHNALTEAYNDYVNELRAIYEDAKLEKEPKHE